MIAKGRDGMRRRVSYEALEDIPTDPGGEIHHDKRAGRMLWIEYFIFMVLGIEMLWAWCALSEFPVETMIAESL